MKGRKFLMANGLDSDNRRLSRVLLASVTQVLLPEMRFLDNALAFSHTL